ncbi:hypothetical protein [Microtetraspora fusca]|uniref:hypothetical protein n=1 Tax=Microtetraspora fusca TaxID=1997 RepID=UPI000834FB16|nr:hypothetical protein [Microtetraspora fusca]
MNLLEQRYRFILKMLPAPYRAEREEEMVEAFLEGAGPACDEQNARPSWREVASIAALAVRSRLGGLGAGPRYRAIGDAVRLVALLGLGYQAVIGWIATAFSLHILGYLPGQSLVIAPGSQMPELLSIAKSLVWIIAFAALALGKVRTAKLLTTLGLLYMLVMAGIDAFTWPRTVIDSAPHILATMVPVLALLTAYHPDAPVRRSPPMTALPLGLAALYIAIALAFTNTWGMAVTPGHPAVWVASWIDPQGVTVAALLIAGLLCLMRDTTPAWRLGLAIVAASMAAARSPLFLIDVKGPVQPLAITLIIQSTALLTLCLVLIVASLRVLPRPTVPLRGGS